MSMRKLFPLLMSMLLVLSACQLSPTLNASKNNTPTAVPSGSLIFEDDFSKTSSGWDQSAILEGGMDYSAGGFRIVVNEAQANFWSTSKHDLTDARIEVDEGRLGGPDENRVGLICRYANNSYYFFIVTHDGFYGIGLYKEGQTSLLGQTEMQSNSIINRGTNVNHLRADCVGNTLTLYVNGEKLAETQDATLTHGDVGILAGAFSEPGVDIIFDNFVAIQP